MASKPETVGVSGRVANQLGRVMSGLPRARVEICDPRIIVCFIYETLSTRKVRLDTNRVLGPGANYAHVLIRTGSVLSQ